MTQRDEALQQHLANLEAGFPLNTLLSRLSEAEAEVASLLTLAAALRAVPDPPVDQVKMKARDEKIMAAIYNSPKPGTQPSATGQRWWSFRLAGGLTLALILLVTLWVSSLKNFLGHTTNVATAASVTGHVEVSTTDEASDWRVVTNGDGIQADQRLRTGPDSAVTLTFFDGSQTHLEPDTEVAITRLDGRHDSLIAELNQYSGKTVHNIVPLQEDDAAFVVHTPSGTARVQGTTFSVDVDVSGQTLFAVGEGQVTVTAAGQTILLTAGQATTTLVDQPPTQPITFPDTATATPDPHAQPSLSFEPDELVAQGCQASLSVTGTLLNTGTPPDDVAVNVKLSHTIIRGASLVRAVTLEPSAWDVIPAGEQVDFMMNIALNSDWMVAPEDTEIKVRVFVANEANRPTHHVTRLTVTIVLQCQNTAIPLATPSITITPAIIITPTATATPTVTAGPTVTVTPTLPGGTDCTGADSHPQGNALANQYDVPYDEIMGWFCAGFGFGEIDLAYSLSLQTGTPVAEIFAMRQTGMGWGEIMQELGVLPGGGPPDGAGPPDDPGPPDGAGPPGNAGPLGGPFGGGPPGGSPPGGGD